MEQYFGQLTELVGDSLPRFILAILVLVAGWVVALIAKAVTRGLLNRTKVDNKVAEFATGGEGGEAPAVEDAAGRIVFWIVMAFALVAFLSLIGLGTVAAPLEALLSQVMAFLPRLFSAGILVALAWLVATGLRYMVSKGLAAIGLDKRFGDEMGDDVSPPSRMLAETIYWLVFLFFLPVILESLGLEGLLGPINTLLAELLAFLPNLFGAAIIMAVGWVLARVVQRVVTSLLAASGVDSLGERVGVSQVLGEKKLSNLLGLIVYILILIPIIVMALDALGLQAVSAPATAMLERVMAAVPSLFGAAIILAVAYLVGRLIADLVTRLLSSMGFNNFLEKIGFRQPSAEGKSPAQLVGWIALVAIMLFATIEALSIMDFHVLAEIVLRFTVFLGNVLLGVIILAVGFYFASLAAAGIQSSGSPNANLLSTLARTAILVLAGAMALRQAGLAEDIINLAFGLLLGAVAVAVALAFGFGGRDLAARQLDKWRNKLD